jgi:hypothetical protein
VVELEQPQAVALRSKLELPVVLVELFPSLPVMLEPAALSQLVPERAQRLLAAIFVSPQERALLVLAARLQLRVALAQPAVVVSN